MTIIAQQERKDIVTPSGRYYATYEWILDEATLVPVGVRIFETHGTESAEGFGEGSFGEDGFGE